MLIDLESETFKRGNHTICEEGVELRSSYPVTFAEVIARPSLKHKVLDFAESEVFCSFRATALVGACHTAKVDLGCSIVDANCGVELLCSHKSKIYEGVRAETLTPSGLITCLMPYVCPLCALPWERLLAP